MEKFVVLIIPHLSDRSMFQNGRETVMVRFKID